VAVLKDSAIFRTHLFGGTTDFRTTPLTLPADSKEGSWLPPGPLCAWRRDAPRLRDFGFAALGGLHSAFYHPRDPALVSLLGGCQQQMSEQNALMFKICLPSSLKFAV